MFVDAILTSQQDRQLGFILITFGIILMATYLYTAAKGYIYVPGAEAYGKAEFKQAPIPFCIILSLILLFGACLIFVGYIQI